MRDIAFRAFDAASGGTQAGLSLTQTITLVNGLLTTVLDISAGVFTGDARWLDLNVRCPAGGGNLNQLTPRLPLTATPFATSVVPGAIVMGSTN